MSCFLPCPSSLYTSSRFIPSLSFLPRRLVFPPFPLFFGMCQDRGHVILIFLMDLDYCIASLLEHKLLDESAVKVLCCLAKEILVNESNVHYISTPVTIVGDVHG